MKWNNFDKHDFEASWRDMILKHFEITDFDLKVTAYKHCQAGYQVHSDPYLWMSTVKASLGLCFLGVSGSPGEKRERDKTNDDWRFDGWHSTEMGPNGPDIRRAKVNLTLYILSAYIYRSRPSQPERSADLRALQTLNYYKQLGRKFPSPSFSL